ncbi:hypothetical protein GCM10007350_00340 [Jeongeupia chitinilytica]|uniref:Uncharacterized protein n=1 Tax=Jeongeupia chitinilytica TaxID=1041641 RepID=A0ABQ3GW30_9NEIS|nr:hypothetical protein GCM10007350_00340 [Jeongeupia chitinilytica]
MAVEQPGFVEAADGKAQAVTHRGQVLAGGFIHGAGLRLENTASVECRGRIGEPSAAPSVFRLSFGTVYLPRGGFATWNVPIGDAARMAWVYISAFSFKLLAHSARSNRRAHR